MLRTLVRFQTEGLGIAFFSTGPSLGLICPFRVSAADNDRDVKTNVCPFYNKAAIGQVWTGHTINHLLIEILETKDWSA